MSQAPSVERTPPDSLTLETEGPLLEGEVGRLAYEALVQMHDPDDPEGAKLTQAVKPLAAHVRELADGIARLDETRAPNLQPQRWSLYYLLAELESEEAVDRFAAAATRKIDAIPQGDRRGCHTPEDGEVVISVMAVEGLARLMGSARDAAQDALLRVVAEQPRLAIRRPAAQALLAADPDLRSSLEGLLPEDQRFVLDMRRVSPADVSAQVPGPGGPGTAGPPPLLPGDTTAPRAHPTEA